MAALKKERRVFLWHLRPRPVPIEAPKPVTMIEILTLIKEEYEAGRARAFLSDEARILDDDDPNRDPRHQIYIAEFQTGADGKSATFLFNRGDPNTVSPAFISSDTGGVRIEHPKEKESPGWSAHLVISLTGKAGVHKACFEQMVKVSSSLVIAALDRIISRAATKKKTYFYPHTIGKGKKAKKEVRPYRPYLALSRVPSEKLEDDLKQGYLSSVTLTRRKSYYRGPGADRLVTKQEERVKITTRKLDDKNVVDDFISGVVDRGRDDGFENVSFRLEGLPGGQTKDATMSLDESDAMEALYVRAHRLTDFETNLDGCYSKICPAIEAGMLSLLGNKSAWRET